MESQSMKRECGFWDGEKMVSFNGKEADQVFRALAAEERRSRVLADAVDGVIPKREETAAVGCVDWAPEGAVGKIPS